MKIRVGGDNRNGSVSVKSGTRGDARDENYNIDPSLRYQKIKRVLSQKSGSSKQVITATLDTMSEFLSYADGECNGLWFHSKGTVEGPLDPAAVGHGIVQESIWMNFRLEAPAEIELDAHVTSDLDIAEVMLQGPQFDKPVRIYDESRQTYKITKPGDYSLRGGYQLSVRYPNSGLGGRPITVEIEALLTRQS
ncbi:MAG TPA: hypothetical protein VFV34_11980 [Blastocatellia bacterium]|nr:hypothetical protein [Blastocatellia bacterium]